MSMIRKFVFGVLFYMSPFWMVAQNVNWKTIDTQVNSFEVPLDWRNSDKDLAENEFYKRTTSGYWIWTMVFKNQYKVNNHFRDAQQFAVEVVARADGRNLSIKEAQNVLCESKKTTKTDLFESENEICYKYIYDAPDMSGKLFNWTRIHYYREYNGQVHSLVFLTQTHNMTKIPNLEERFLHIVKSYKIKDIIK